MAAHASVARTTTVDRLDADLIALAHEIADDEGLGMQPAAVLATLYRDELTAYARTWDALAAAQRAQHVARCPMCGAEVVSVQSYIGGRGYMFFSVCSGDGSHSSKPA